MDASLRAKLEKIRTAHAAIEQPPRSGRHISLWKS
jgi:hypothetical protein